MSCTYSVDGGPHTSTSSLIVLQIDKKFIKCSRKELISNSDYFKAMFDGNFVESSKNIIPLKGVEVDAMVTILKLLWDREHNFEDEEILPVLQAACMLQFLKIKELCIERLLKILSVKNCLKIWVCTEQLDLQTVYLKAKSVALLEFMVVRDCDYFLELTLKEIVNYLGNINLQCPDEITVFNAAVKWYCHVGDENSGIMLKLLHCLDFTKITEAQVEENLMNCEVMARAEVINILQCILAIKRGSFLPDFGENCIEQAHSLLKSKSRNLQGFPCILVENPEAQQKTDVLYYDKFNRKRRYNVLGDSLKRGPSVMYIGKMPSLKKLFHIDYEICANLEGFKIVGYKQFIYLLGGEYGYGTGDWNLTFYIFDTINEKEVKRVLPFPRRHFEACICGNYLFIIGGVGPFRVKQKNLLWYHLTEEKWSNEVKLPCSGRQIKCCSFNDNLFILDINKQCGYSFSASTGVWTKMEISFSPGDSDDVLPSFSTKLSLFSYRSSLYIKESKLYELKVWRNSLMVIKQSELSDFQETGQVESVISNNVLYSLKEQWMDSDEQPIFLESFDVDSLETALRRPANNGGSEVSVKFWHSLILFTVFHHSLVGGNDLINGFP